MEDYFTVINNKTKELYSRIEILEKYSFNVQEYKNKLNNLNNTYSRINNNNNNFLDSSTLSLKDKSVFNNLIKIADTFIKELDKIIDTINGLERYTGNYYYYNDELLSQKKAYLDSIKNDKQFNDETFNGYISTLLLQLTNYNDLESLGYKYKIIKEKLFRLSYNAIKTEFVINGKSTILNYLFRINKVHEIINFIIDDTNKYNYIAPNNLNQEELNELIFLISLKEDNYDSEFDDLRYRYISKFKETKENIEQNNINIEYKKNKINITKENAKSNRKELIKLIGVIVLSVSTIVSSCSYIIDLLHSKKITKNYYRLEKECYDTVNGKYNTTSYSENYDNKIILKEYSSVDENGNRELKIYYLPETENTDSYLTSEISDEYLASTTTIQDALSNSVSEEEYKSLEIIKNVDLDNHFQKDKVDETLYLYLAMVVLLWLLLELLACEKFDCGLMYSIFKDGFDEISLDYEYIFTYKSELKETIKELEQLNHYNEEEQKIIEETIKLDNELIDKYNVLFKDVKRLKL